MDPKKWNIPLTYEPKIPAVIAGTCMQTIRTGRKFNEGDLIRFYTWQGRPYWSKRTTITEYASISMTFPIGIYPWGIESGKNAGEWYLWNNCDLLAEKDGIVPPTGETLRDVLIAKNGKIPAEGIDAQIVRWSP
jgi:hypothetical protein